MESKESICAAVIKGIRSAARKSTMTGPVPIALFVTRRSGFMQMRPVQPRIHLKLRLENQIPLILRAAYSTPPRRKNMYAPIYRRYITTTTSTIKIKKKTISLLVFAHRSFRSSSSRLSITLRCNTINYTSSQVFLTKVNLHLFDISEYLSIMFRYNSKEGKSAYSLVNVFDVPFV